MSEPTLILGDCLERLADLDPDSVDAIITDPPYGIRFMGQAWDGAQIEHEVERRRALGREADGGDFGNAAQSAGIYDVSVTGNRAFQSWTEEWARAAYRVLKPGGHLLAFGGTRTYHRMATGIEDAGFEVRDTLAWMFGSGFPKSLDVSKAIDARAGATREVVGIKRYANGEHGPESYGSAPTTARGFGVGEEGVGGDFDAKRTATAPASDDAKRWDGWGTALKPAFEPIVVARKPLVGTVARNVLEHGVGAMNIDGCRIAFVSVEDEDEDEAKAKNAHADFGTEPGGNQVYGDYSMVESKNYDAPGRWPANVLLGHHPECVSTGAREVAGTGHTPASRPSSTFAAHAQPEEEERSWRRELVEAFDCHPDCPVRILDEQTGALRARGNVTPTRRDEASWFGASGASGAVDSGDVGGASRFFYCAKVSRAERSAGLDGFDPLPLNWSSGEQSPGTFQSDGTDRSARNHHPTVKPISLMRWLIRLVTPPGGLVLDPFLGSGSTGCAAALEGARFVGIEREPDYMGIAEARIRFWAEHGEEALRVVESDRARQAVADSGQLDLLG